MSFDSSRVSLWKSEFVCFLNSFDSTPLDQSFCSFQRGSNGQIFYSVRTTKYLCATSFTPPEVIQQTLVFDKKTLPPEAKLSLQLMFSAHPDDKDWFGDFFE